MKVHHSAFNSQNLASAVHTHGSGIRKHEWAAIAPPVRLAS